MEKMTHENLTPDPKENSSKRFSLMEANVFLLVCAILFIVVGGFVQSINILLGIFVIQYIIVGAPPLVYAYLKDKNIKAIFRFNKISFKTVLKIILLAFLLLPLIGVGNLIAITILSHFNLVIESPLPGATSGITFIIYMLLFSFSPAICEELFFRGMVLNAYEKSFGAKWGAICSALLFGIFHFNVQNLIGPIILGIVFAYLVQVTNSIFASVVAHATNNGIAVFVTFLSSFADNAQQVDQMDVLGNSSALAAMLLVMIPLAILTTALAFGLINNIKKSYRGNDKIWIKQKFKIPYLQLIPALILVMIYISVFIVFWLQIFR